MRILVTGGAGFIGSHMVDFLCKEHEVIVLDNFVSGYREFLSGAKCEIIEGDIRDKKLVESICKRGVDAIYHFAADPDVRMSAYRPVENFDINVMGTFTLLEAARKNDVSLFVFISSSTVYGEAEIIPTPETAPILPISNYGASKAAAEAYVMSYSNSYGIHGVILRYANIIGPRGTHGVIVDFYRKLKKNPHELEILGNGLQRKSYLHVYDAVRATAFAVEHAKKPVDIFNVGSESQLTVNEIADIVVDEMGLKNVKYRYTGGDRGWVGDVPVMLLSMKKLFNLGFKVERDIKDAVRDTVRWIKKNEHLIMKK